MPPSVLVDSTVLLPPTFQLPKLPCWLSMTVSPANTPLRLPPDSVADTMRSYCLLAAVVPVTIKANGVITRSELLNVML